MKINHPASSYGKPVIHDDDGLPINYADGLRAIRRKTGWSVADLAARCGVSARTVENWEQGRNRPPTPALLLLSRTKGI